MMENQTIPLNELVEQENIKAELCALSSIHEELFRDRRHAEAIVLVNVQKRLRKLLGESASERK